MSGSLSYVIDYSDFYIAGRPLTGEFATDEFVIRVAGTSADVELLGIFASQEEARQRVEPYLQAWEMSAASLRGWPVFRFRFQSARIPRADATLGSTGTIDLAVSAALAFQLDALPSAPTRPLSGPWIDAIWEHFRNYREGREALVPTAYMCLELLEASVPGERQKKARKAAADHYGLDFKVLDRLGKLTAVSDPQKGRKMPKNTPEPLTPEEEREIERTLVDIVRAVVREKLE